MNNNKNNQRQNKTLNKILLVTAGFVMLFVTSCAIEYKVNIVQSVDFKNNQILMVDTATGVERIFVGDSLNGDFVDALQYVYPGDTVRIYNDKYEIQRVLDDCNTCVDLNYDSIDARMERTEFEKIKRQIKQSVQMNQGRTK